jgi:hypothetical protein
MLRTRNAPRAIDRLLHPALTISKLLIRNEMLAGRMGGGSQLVKPGPSPRESNENRWGLNRMARWVRRVAPSRPSNCLNQRVRD